MDASASRQAAAQVTKEEVELQLRTILSPIDGSVLQVKIRVGEYVPAALLSTPLMTLGVTNPLHIRVDIDESEIPRFQSRAKAFASVRGRPEVKVALDFVRIEPYVFPKKTLHGGVSERIDPRVLQIIYSVSPTHIEAITGLKWRSTSKNVRPNTWADRRMMIFRFGMGGRTL